MHRISFPNIQFSEIKIAKPRKTSRAATKQSNATKLKKEQSSRGKNRWGLGAEWQEFYSEGLGLIPQKPNCKLSLNTSKSGENELNDVLMGSSPRHREQTCGRQGEGKMGEDWTEGPELVDGNWTRNKILLYSTHTVWK